MEAAYEYLHFQNIYLQPQRVLLLRRRHLADKKDFPFPESLLKLLRLDIWQYEPLIKNMEKALLRFYKTEEQQNANIILAGLG